MKNGCVGQLRCLADNLEKRILPTFNSITEEADKIAEEAWDRINQSTIGPDFDPADGAELAVDEGHDHYTKLAGLQQGLINFSAVFCHHVFEQQLFYFHRKELLKPQDENNKNLLNITTVIAKFIDHGIAIEDFKSWPKVYELRHVANVVKHGDGPSVEIIKTLRPEMFTDPDLRQDEVLVPWFTSNPLPVFLPGVGQDFYVTINDLREYTAAVIDFWMELGNILEQQQ